MDRRRDQAELEYERKLAEFMDFIGEATLEQFRANMNTSAACRKIREHPTTYRISGNVPVMDLRGAKQELAGWFVRDTAYVDELFRKALDTTPGIRLTKFSTNLPFRVWDGQYTWFCFKRKTPRRSLLNVWYTAEFECV